MEFTKITVREWLNNYKNGEYNNGDRNTMCKAGWWDWFCSDEALLGRLHKIASVIKNVAKDNDFILDNYSVRFKNCCPLCYPLYDVINFVPMNEELMQSHRFFISIDDKCKGVRYVALSAKGEHKCNYLKELAPYVRELSTMLQVDYVSANPYIIHSTKTMEQYVDGKWIPDDDDNVENWNREITNEEYKMIVGKSTIAFFTALGGTETATRDDAGRIVRLVSTRPDKQVRAVYTFEFVAKEEV